MVRSILHIFVKAFLGFCTLLGIYGVVAAFSKETKKEEEKI
jgi:hypothetical protein